MKTFLIVISAALTLLPLQVKAELLGNNWTNAPFTQPSIPAIIPDQCIPTGFGEYCVTFTNSGTQTLSGLLNSSIQQAQMQQQQILQAPLGSIASIATQAGINAQIQQLAGSMNPEQIANAIAQAIINNHAQATQDQQTLNSAMQKNGTGQLAATQIQGEILQNLTAKVEQLNTLQSSQQIQNQSQINSAYRNAGAELDLNGPVTSGWLI